MDDLANISPEHFSTLIGTELPLLNSELAFEVEGVELLKSPSPRSSPFSVTLLAPPATQGAQGVYHLTHPTLGTLELFLVPIATQGDRLRFELVFN